MNLLHLLDINQKKFKDKDKDKDFRHGEFIFDPKEYATMDTLSFLTKARNLY